MAIFPSRLAFAAHHHPKPVKSRQAWYHHSPLDELNIDAAATPDPPPTTSYASALATGTTEPRDGSDKSADSKVLEEVFNTIYELVDAEAVAPSSLQASAPRACADALSRSVLRLHFAAVT